MAMWTQSEGRGDALGGHGDDLEENVTLGQCVALLEARRVRICGELADFAQPVAACDADFNTLLAERAAIVQALAELLPLARAEAHVPHPRDDAAPRLYLNRRREDHDAGLARHGRLSGDRLHPDLFNGFSTNFKTN